ncbi:MAG: hypothetical protein RMJ44_11110 [Cytophagales bacterium]|nr:hypothetical protein [Bernardetiaceae bacterium]MDW8211624.1 hypothetical protein [Cytophagales bacterium]
MSFAPIALFCYRRPWHLQRTLEALQANAEASESVLYIFADGPKPNASLQEKENVDAVRRIIRQQWNFKEVIIKEYEENQGLANSLVSGITQVVNKHEQIIVLEDDMVTSPYFLKFMNDALECYAHVPEVAAVTAYIYDIPHLPETFFLNDPGCWGWATWRQAWQLFNPDGKQLAREIARQKRIEEFNYENTYPFYQMLIDQTKGKNNSWAIRWYASVFLANKLALYPCKTLVENIGNDESGTHPGAEEFYRVQLHDQPIRVTPQPPLISTVARAAIVKYLAAQNYMPPVWKKLFWRIKSALLSLRT